MHSVQMLLAYLKMRSHTYNGSTYHYQNETKLN